MENTKTQYNQLATMLDLRNETMTIWLASTLSSNQGYELVLARKEEQDAIIQQMEDEILSDYITPQPIQTSQPIKIYVTCNLEYGWSVSIEGHAESCHDGLTKVEAMKQARIIGRTGNYIIEAEKVDRSELMRARWERMKNVGWAELGYY